MRKKLLHFQIKTKTQHQHIHKHKSVRRNLFKLTSNTAKHFNLKITEQIKTLPTHNVLFTKTTIGARFIIA